MRITVDRDQFLGAFRKISGIVKQRSSMPVLSNVLVKVDRDGAELVATDLEITTTVLIDRDFPVKHPVRHLFGHATKDILASLDKGEVVIEMPDNKKQKQEIVILQGATEFTLPVLDPDDYHETPTHDGPTAFTSKGGDLIRAVDNVLFSVATDPARYNLTGFSLCVRNERLIFAATNGFTLALCEVKVEGYADTPIYVVQGRCGKTIAGAITDDDVVAVSVDAEHKFMFFDTDTATIACRLIQTAFPDVESIVGLDHPHTVTATQNILLNAVKRVSIVGDGKVRLTTGRGALALFTEGQLGSAKEFVPNKSAVAELDYSFVPGQLVDALGHLPGPLVKVRFPGEYGPVIITPEQESDLRHINVVMPIRI